MTDIDVGEVRSGDIFVQLHMIARELDECRPQQVIDAVSSAAKLEEDYDLPDDTFYWEQHHWQQAIGAYYESKFWESDPVDPEELVS